MVKIKNIIRNGDTLSCDYYPECKDKKGHVTYSISKKEIVAVTIVPDFELPDYKPYAWHACVAMRKFVNKDKFPEEYTSTWY